MRLSLTLLSVLFAAACATPTSDVHRADDLNYCIRDPELIVSSAPAMEPRPIAIEYCNLVSSDGQKKVITARLDNSDVQWVIPTPLGAKVFAEVRFADEKCCLLMAYGYHSPDKNGNLFDFDVYELVAQQELRSGKSSRRPSLVALLRRASASGSERGGM